MLVIGLTGGIACGKSTVSAYLKKRGAVIIDGDRIAKELSEPNEPIWKAYVNHFGNKILNEDKSLNRRLIGQIVFADEQEKNWMNSTLHPIIKNTIIEKLNFYKSGQNNKNVVVLDIPLLYEAGWDKFADEVWVVQIERKLQIKRIQERDGLSYEEAVNRIDAQMAISEKAKRADVVIDSSNAPEITLEKVAQICKERKINLEG